MKQQKRTPAPPATLDEWQKTPYANLVRYVPSKKYFARIRVGGKLIRQSLKTTTLTVAKFRLADLEKAERLLAENATAVAGGKMTVGDALKTYRTRLHGDRSLKPRTKAYREECISKLLRTCRRLRSAGCWSSSKGFLPQTGKFGPFSNELTRGPQPRIALHG